MAFSDVFDEQEWTLVLQGPMLAALAITAADPNGLIGAVQEASATAASLKEARDSAAEGSLISEVIAAYETSEGRSSVTQGTRALAKGRRAAEVCEAAVETLGQIAASVRNKAPEEASAYVEWLRATAVRVAEATSEGGFLGFGGEKVSEAETKTLAEIEAALGLATA